MISSHAQRHILQIREIKATRVVSTVTAVPTGLEEGRDDERREDRAR